MPRYCSLPMKGSAYTLCCQFMCVYAHALSVNVYVWEREEEEEREGVRLGFLSSSIITPQQLIPLHSALMELALLLSISAQILVQSFTLIACSCPPLFAFAICCDRQLGTLFCLITISVHSYYSTTERPRGPDTCRESPILTFHCKRKHTMQCIVYCEYGMFPFCPACSFQPALKGSISKSVVMNVLFLYLRPLSSEGMFIF